VLFGNHGKYGDQQSTRTNVYASKAPEHTSMPRTHEALKPNALRTRHARATLSHLSPYAPRLREALPQEITALQASASRIYPSTQDLAQHSTARTAQHSTGLGYRPPRHRMIARSCSRLAQQPVLSCRHTCDLDPTAILGHPAPSTNLSHRLNEPEHPLLPCSISSPALRLANYPLF